MKRLIIAAGLILITVAASAGELFCVGMKSDDFLRDIEIIDSKMLKNDFSSALSYCKSLSERWDKAAENIDILLIHDYVDNIGMSITQMQAHIENCNPDMYFAESAGAKKGLASIKRSEYPNFENIL